MLQLPKVLRAAGHKLVETRTNTGYPVPICACGWRGKGFTNSEGARQEYRNHVRLMYLRSQREAAHD